MSNFDKIIIPLLDNNTKTLDFTELAGFIGCYTYDPDKPSQFKEFYIAYDETVRNKYSIDRARRFEQSKNIKKKYVKIVNNKPYYIYSFWVCKELGNLYKGNVILGKEQKLKILNYWGVVDKISDYILNNNIIWLDSEKALPLEDYREPYFKNGIEIKKSGNP